MTTPDERLEELRRRALAADIEAPTDPEELGRLSMRALLEDIGGVVEPDRPEVAIRLHGPGVPGHEIPVREAAAILISIQEAVASIGQALRHEPTIHGAIQVRILKATELRMSPAVGAGSVVFRLTGAGEQVSGDEAPALTGTDTLVDAAMTELFSLLKQSETQGLESSALAQDLRRLGPRTAKHLADLVKRILADEIDVELTWRNPTGRRRSASLQRQSALAIGRAIDLNRVETKVIDLTGVLVTVSAVTKAELQTDVGDRIKMSADSSLTATLGPFYNKRVVAQVEQTTVWSTNTGKETQTFKLLALRMTRPDDPPATAAPGVP